MLAGAAQTAEKETSLGGCADLAYRTLMALKYTMPRPRMIVIPTAAGRWSICGGVALGSWRGANFSQAEKMRDIWKTTAPAQEARSLQSANE